MLKHTLWQKCTSLSDNERWTMYNAKLPSYYESVFHLMGIVIEGFSK